MGHLEEKSQCGREESVGRQHGSPHGRLKESGSEPPPAPHSTIVLFGAGSAATLLPWLGDWENIETVARDLCERELRAGGNSEDALAAAVDRYWHCVAAEIEAGLIDETGKRLRPFDGDRDLEAYRDWRRRHPDYRVPPPIVSIRLSDPPTAPARPRQVPHNSVVGEERLNGRALRQQLELGRRPHLHLRAVLADWWTHREGCPLRTAVPQALGKLATIARTPSRLIKHVPLDVIAFLRCFEALQHPPEPLSRAAASEEEHQDRRGPKRKATKPPRTGHARKPAITAGPASNRQGGRRSPPRCRRGRWR